MTTLLIVHHSPTAAVQEITTAVLTGARTDEIDGVTVVERTALEATVDDVLAADAYLLGTPANFGYISGALKHFFDVTFTATHEATEKRPYSYWIHGGYDTTGAETAMTSITTGYGWRLSADPLVFTGPVAPDHLERGQELGATMAAVAWSLARDDSGGIEPVRSESRAPC